MSPSRTCDCQHCPAFRRLCEGCTHPCAYSQCSGQCARCPVRCHRRDDLDRWLAAIDGLALDVPLRPQSRFRLTGFFPQLLNQLEIPAALQRAPDVGVGIAKVLTSKGQVSRRALPHEFGSFNLRAQWGLSELTRLICIGNYLDGYLEKLWTAQLRENTWLQVRVLGFNFATSLNFSIYLDDPRMEHLVNVKRTWLTVSRMQETTTLIPIPHLQWAEIMDLQRQLHYARVQGFHTLTMNLQMTRRQSWDTVATGIPIIQEQAPDLHFLFTGVAGLRRMAQLAKAFPTAAFTNATAHYLAQRYLGLSRDGTRLIKNPLEGHPDLILARNARLYQDFLAGLDGHGWTEPRLNPPEESELQAAFREITAALQGRFGFPAEQVAEVFGRLAADEAILAAFRDWLRTGRVDRDFQGSFPNWPASDCIPQPAMERHLTMGGLLNEGMEPLEAFLHLADLACQVDDAIEVLVGQAGY